MSCTVRSGGAGTAIERFDARVVDVVSGSVTGDGPRDTCTRLRRRDDATGIGPGFSGSPISCPDAEGVERIIGAISEGIGREINQLVWPGRSRRSSRAGLRPANASRAQLGPVRQLSGTWALSGAPRGSVRRFTPARSAPGVRCSAPQRRRWPPSRAVDLRPGAAVATALATGDLGLSAVGTVAYRDGDRVWAFAHPLDGLGARSLPLQDAYVYDMVRAPGFVGGSYKLSAPGHVVGTLRHDGRNAVTGVLGQFPRTVPLSVTARDGDRRERRHHAREHRRREPPG